MKNKKRGKNFQQTASTSGGKSIAVPEVCQKTQKKKAIMAKETKGRNRGCKSHPIGGKRVKKRHGLQKRKHPGESVGQKKNETRVWETFSFKK